MHASCMHHKACTVCHLRSTRCSTSFPPARPRAGRPSTSCAGALHAACACMPGGGHNVRACYAHARHLHGLAGGANVALGSPRPRGTRRLHTARSAGTPCGPCTAHTRALRAAGEGTRRRTTTPGSLRGTCTKTSSGWAPPPPLSQPYPNLTPLLTTSPCPASSLDRDYPRLRPPHAPPPTTTTGVRCRGRVETARATPSSSPPLLLSSSAALGASHSSDS